MTHNQARELIEHLLKVDQKRQGIEFKNSHEQMLYERGYLTGLLMSIIADDFYACNKITRKIKDIDGY